MKMHSHVAYFFILCLVERRCEIYQGLFVTNFSIPKYLNYRFQISLPEINLRPNESR
jgi:hypothetical protein